MPRWTLTCSTLDSALVTAVLYFALSVICSVANRQPNAPSISTTIPIKTFSRTGIRDNEPLVDTRRLPRRLGDCLTRPFLSIQSNCLIVAYFMPLIP